MEHIKMSRKFKQRSGEIEAVKISLTTPTNEGESITINHDGTGSTDYPIDIDTETTGAAINISMAATTTPLISVDSSSFQALNAASTVAERLLVKTGTNTRYIKLYSA